MDVSFRKQPGGGGHGLPEFLHIRRRPHHTKALPVNGVGIRPKTSGVPLVDGDLRAGKSRRQIGQGGDMVKMTVAQ